MEPLSSQDYAERRSIRFELRSLLKEEKQRQQKAVEEVLKHASVVCATLTGVAGYSLRELPFHVTVVDEAAQVSRAGDGMGFSYSPWDPGFGETSVNHAAGGLELMACHALTCALTAVLLMHCLGGYCVELLRVVRAATGRLAC